MSTSEMRQRPGKAQSGASSNGAAGGAAGKPSGAVAPVEDARTGLGSLWQPTSLLVALLGFAATVAVEKYLPKQVYAPNKPYDTLLSFFPFYLTEHSDLTCRRLHFAGSSIVLAIGFMNPTMFINAVAAGSVGLALMPIFMSQPTGYVEGVAALLAFLLLSRKTTGSWKPPLAVLAAGYGFAWVGHFFFEHNKPASFTYPVYSLASDFIMWSKIVTGSIKF